MDELPDDLVDNVNVELDISGGSNPDEETESITIEEAVQRLTQSWINEQAAPKLLPHQYEIVEAIVQSIDEFEQSTADYTETQKLDLAFNIRRMEVSRLQYVINSYVRTRLQKIEKDPIGVLKENENRANDLVNDPTNKREQLLEEKEVVFAEKFFESSRKLLHDEFLGNFAPALQKIPCVSEVNPNARVFFEVIADQCENMTVPNLKDKELALVVELKKGDRFLAPFKSVEELLEKGHIKLL